MSVVTNHQEDPFAQVETDAIEEGDSNLENNVARDKLGKTVSFVSSILAGLDDQEMGDFELTELCLQLVRRRDICRIAPHLLINIGRLSYLRRSLKRRHCSPKIMACWLY